MGQDTKYLNSRLLVECNKWYQILLLSLFKPGVLKFSLMYLDVGLFFIHRFGHSVVPFNLEMTIP